MDPFPPGTLLGEAVPRGFRRDLHRNTVGDAAALELLGEAVLSWAVQRVSGIAVRSEGRDAPPVTAGLRATIAVPFGPVTIQAPVQVSEVVRREDLIGFLYRALPGHPEVGEEAFLVRREGRETVLELRVLSHPAFPWSLAAPVGRAVQLAWASRYLRALGTPVGAD